MKTYWRYQSEPETFARLGVADSQESAVESLRDFIADLSGTAIEPLEEMGIAVEVKGSAVYLTVLDSD